MLKIILSPERVLNLTVWLSYPLNGADSSLCLLNSTLYYTCLNKLPTLL